MEVTKMDVWACPDSENERGFSLILIHPDKRWYANNDDINLGEVTVTFTAPDDMTEQEMRLKAIDTLKDKQKRIIAEAQLEAVQLQKRIDDMLLIAYVPEVINEDN